MSDLLLYATTLENNRLRDIKIAAATDAAATVDWTSVLSPSDTPGIDTDAALNPSFVTDWQTTITPLADAAASKTNQLKICDTSGYYRCGSDCAWTVPAGVSTITVQMWNPGNGSGSNCCCGGAPFGASGSFALFDLSVTAGETVVFCAGCAYCCYAEQTTPGLVNGHSYVCYCGSTDAGRICTSTPCNTVCRWNCDVVLSGYFSSVGCNNQLPSDSCGPNACSGWNFCWDSGNDDMYVPHIFSSCNYVVTDSAGSGMTGLLGTVYAIPAIWPKAQIGGGEGSGGNFEPNSYTVSSPVFGFESLTCCENWGNGQTCSGCCRCANQGVQQGPGFGGYASTVHGGCNACGGDAGGMGMICVSWNCD